MRSTSLGRFVLRVAAWLPPAFLIWYLAGPILAWPIGLLTDFVLKIGFGDLVSQVQQEGHSFNIVSTLKPALATTQAQANAVLSVSVNTLLYSFGLPLLAALILATREPRPLRRLAVGYVVLAPLVTWGVVAEFLKRVVFDTAPAVAAQTGFGPVQRELIVFAYQFGALILPAVAPAVYWIVTHRRFVEGFTARAATAQRAP